MYADLLVTRRKSNIHDNFRTINVKTKEFGVQCKDKNYWEILSETHQPKHIREYRHVRFVQVIRTFTEESNPEYFL